MAQSLEKAFLQKVAQMPQEEVELPPPLPRSKPGKPGRKGRGNASEHCKQANTARHVQSATITHTVHAYDLIHTHMRVWAQIILLDICFSQSASLLFSSYPHPLSPSFWRSDNSSSGPSCVPVSVLTSHPGNTRLHPLYPPTDTFDQEPAPFPSNWTKHPYHYGSASHTAHHKGNG